MKESSFESIGDDEEISVIDHREDEKISVKETLESIHGVITEFQTESNEYFLAREKFIKHRAVIEKEILEFIKFNEGSPFVFDIDYNHKKYFDIVDMLDLIDETSKDIALRAFNVSSYYIESNLSRSILRKRDLYESKNIKLENSLVGYILKSFEFSDNEIFDFIYSWLSIKDDDLAELLIEKSLRNIKNLEEHEVGTTRYLYNNFGIRCFGRYYARELTKQYDERDSMERYGVYFQAVMDWNGSLIHTNHSSELRDLVEENSFILRIVESAGKIELAKRLLYLRDTYNQKIKFMYMHVHGNAGAIGFGDREGNNRMLLQEDLKGVGVQKIKELFEDDSEIVLASCMTGSPGGLAEEISNTFNVKVVASDKATKGEPKSIEAFKNESDDNLIFKVEFDTEDLEGEQGKVGTVIFNPK